MKSLLMSLLILGSFSTYASDESIHEELCRAAYADFPVSIISVKDCLVDTELEGSIYNGDHELSITFYSCVEESEYTYSYDLSIGEISSGDSWIGDSCNK